MLAGVGRPWGEAKGDAPCQVVKPASSTRGRSPVSGSVFARSVVPPRVAAGPRFSRLRSQRNVDDRRIKLTEIPDVVKFDLASSPTGTGRAVVSGCEAVLAPPGIEGGRGTPEDEVANLFMSEP